MYTINIYTAKNRHGNGSSRMMEKLAYVRGEGGRINSRRGKMALNAESPLH